jgi:flagellar basal body rod protein FlgC
MSPEKYAAGLALNAHENTVRILAERIATAEAQLAIAKEVYARASAGLEEKRVAVARMRD